MNAAPLVDRKELPRPLAKMLQHIEDARLHLTQANISESDKVILDEVLEHAINLVEAVRP